MQTFSLYIHIPWCIKKCPYCDFNSHTARERIPEEAYAECLLLDLQEHIEPLKHRKLISIFFGGGTPSLFSPQTIAKILNGIHQNIPIHSATEITLEANPGTVDESRFVGFRTAGINRLSLGIQSLQDEKLKALGRIHDREHAIRAIHAAKTAGFLNFNLDLMHGLPGQSLEDALQDLKDALIFEPPHLSWYQLTIEPNTYFHYKPPALPEDEILWDMQEQGKQLLLDHGLKQYEVSAYAHPLHQCQHNINYWEFGDYLGIGAGAHSKITHHGVITRHWQVKNPKNYLDTMNSDALNVKIISEQDAIFEFMLNALRLTQGVPLSLFTDRTGIVLNKIEPLLTKLKNRNLLLDDPTWLCATSMGQRFLNNLISEFLSPVYSF